MANEESKRFLRLVFNHIVQSVKPRELISSQVKFDKNKLLVNSNSYDLTNKCCVVGFGKAVYEMACEVSALLGNNIQKGILSIPDGSLNQTCPDLNEKVFKIFQGAKNNIPDENSYKASKDIFELTKPLVESDILLVLISGGGSALLTYPIPPVTLEDKIAVTKLLSFAGANINEVNVVRKQLSMVKGGKLAEVAYPCQVVSLILSDIINDPVGSIASGPTVRNKDESGSGLKILEKYNLLKKVSENIIIALNGFKNDQKLESFHKSHLHIIGNNKKGLASGKAFIDSRGKACQIITSGFQGNVADVADELCQFTKHVCTFLQNKIDTTVFIKNISALSLLNITEEAMGNVVSMASTDEIYFLFGGETTVNVTGKGKGGRNMELALHFSDKIDNVIEQNKLNNFDVTILSAGTDGIDGPTDSAGAMSYRGLAAIARSQGLDIKKYLLQNDSYNFYKAFNNGVDLITVGHTGTNVMDIIALYIQKKL